MERVFIHLLPPAIKLGQGYVFTRICDSVHGGGGLSHCILGYTPRDQRQAPPPRDQRHAPPRDQRQAPPPGSRHPQHSACWEIRATSGRYASYWNAILFHSYLLNPKQNTSKQTAKREHQQRPFQPLKQCSWMMCSIYQVVSCQ